jgi:hypothetical protein
VASRYCRVSARPADLPAGLITYALQRTIPSVRGSVTPASLHRSNRKYGNINPLSIGVALRLSLRSRLTLIRLALIRKPWSIGGQVSHLPYRYSCLHLLFHALQNASRRAFHAHGMLPYQMYKVQIHSFGTVLDARVLSTPDRSTSELLRTL